jgi:CzcA family heavy metal efflux pump
MNIARFAENNRRAIILAAALISAAGVYGIFSLPSNIYPEVEFPRIVIVAKAGDLSPRLMQVAVTRPLEEAARTVLGVRRVRSKTIRGATEISVLFNPGADMPYGLQLMQGRIDEVKPDLPADTEIQVERMTPSVFPILIVNVTGSRPPAELRDIAMFQLRPLLSRVQGVASVEVLASEEKEISVIVDPRKLAAAKLGLEEVEEALKTTNQIMSVGRLPKDYRQYLVLATAELRGLDDVRNVVVAFRQDRPITIGDLAEVREGVTDRTILITGNGQPGAVVTVARQIGGNILEVSDGVMSALKSYRASLPAGVQISLVYDLAGFVRDAVDNVRDAILIGGLLAILILIAFLRDWRVTLVAATTLPLTMIGTFFIVRLAGGTINLMSMGGLAIAIGLVIDDAIVVVENIFRHRGGGEDPGQATETATKELVAAVVGSTLTTVVVFVPLGLLQGVVGQFFSSLSMTLASAVLLSLVYALLFIPILARRAVVRRRIALPEPAKASAPEAPGPLAAGYGRLLAGALRRPKLVLIATIAFASLGVLLYFGLKSGFLPEMDEGGFVVDYWTPAGTSLPETDRMLRRVEEVIKTTPEVASFSRRTGSELGLFATEQNTGDIVVRLKPRRDRSRTAEEVISVLREHFDREMPGMTIEFVQLLQDMLGDLEGNPEPVEVKLFGDDVPTLMALSEQVQEKIGKITGLVDMVGPIRSNPEMDVRIDPTRAAKAGLTVEQVSAQLAGGLLGEVATEFRSGDRLIGVRVRFPDRFRFDPAFVREFPLMTPSGTVVPLSAAARIEVVEGENELHREDLKQMVPVTARLEDRDLGSGIAEVKRTLDGIAFPLGTSYQIGGLYESQRESFGRMILVLSIAILLVFGVLVAQFKSFTSALVILSAAPLSLVGAFGLLFLTGTPLNVSSFMGLILLVGLIVKNGIILVDYAHRICAECGDLRQALLEAGAIRLRPILMTTLCTLFGLMPLALGLGSGAELQKPLAVAVIGGLTVSTAITLLFVPTLLLVLEKRRARSFDKKPDPA